MALSKQDSAALARATAKAVKEVLDREIPPLVERIKALETKSLADAYCGSFDQGRRYKRGALLTHSGSLWLCLHATGDRPGKSADWRLVAKGQN